MKNKTRINLLSDAEIEDLYNVPVFNDEDRNIFFSLSKDDHVLVTKYKTTKLKIYFILQLGYFRATNNFYTFDLKDVVDDVSYLDKRYFSNSGNKLISKPYRVTIKAQQTVVLKIYNYSEWSSDISTKTLTHLSELLRYYPKTPVCLRELFKYFVKEKIIIPKYRVLQDIFSRAIASEEKRLSQIISSIPDHIRQRLDDLIYSSTSIAQLNAIKSDQKNFQYTALKLEVEKAQELQDLYQFCSSFLPKLNTSKNSIRYYAELAENYYTSQFIKIKKTKQLLYLLCFIYSRYQQLMDNLIVSFKYHMNGIVEGAKNHASQMNAQHNAELVMDFPKLAKFLKWFPSKEKDNPDISYTQLIKEAYSILPKSQFKILAAYMEGSSFDKTSAKWEFYSKSSYAFSRYLRPVMLTVNFELVNINSQLTQLIEVLKQHYSKGKYPAALKIKVSDDITENIAKWIIPYLKSGKDPEYLDPYLFEFYVYWRMNLYVTKGRLVCNDSLSYSDLENDLVPEELVDNAEEIAAKFGYDRIPIFCDERLDESLKDLDLAWEETNANIDNGANENILVTTNEDGKISWTLNYEAKEKLNDSFFKDLPKLEIADLLKFIGDIISLWEGFTHIKHRYIKRYKPQPLALIACLLSEAFGFNVQEMAEICDINLSVLRSTRQNCIRVESLCETNDIISNYMNSLPIFTAWNLLKDKLLADADGQKHSTTNSTIQSRYSTKYCGKGQGISLYSLMANNVVVNAKSIGLNEYEGHGLFDIVQGNKSNIIINYITGDNHSINPVNFIIFNAVNIGYLPSIKNIQREAAKLYSHKKVSTYEGSTIQPKAQINKDLIKSKKRWIIRILLSLIMQEGTQTTIIRKLSSHDRYSQLNAALFEYNKILKSTHVLNMINDINLRKAIRTARNRTEAYHQLQGVIKKVYNGIFKGKRIIDNQVSAHAARLVANCIIAYNSTILNSLYEKMVTDGVDQSVIDEFLRTSPIAWGYLTFTGRYNFKNSKTKIDLEKTVNSLVEKLLQTLLKKR